MIKGQKMRNFRDDDSYFSTRKIIDRQAEWPNLDRPTSTNSTGRDGQNIKPGS